MKEIWKGFHLLHANEVVDEEEEDGNDGDRWIAWFCRLESNQYICEVDEEYIRDAFNLYGLRAMFQNFTKANDIILGPAPTDEEESLESEEIEIYKEASDLYGLIHARYILSPKGLHQMRDMYRKGQFGICPRVLCNQQKVVPVGISYNLRNHRARVYCPKCQECYDSKRLIIDGAFYGPSFPGVFFQVFQNMNPLQVPRPFVPKIFGFRIHGKRSIVDVKLENGEYGYEIQSVSTHDSGSGKQTSSAKSSCE